MILNEESLHQIIKNLNSEYSIIGDIIYFSDFFKTGGETAVFRYLNEIRKDEFLHNERIVFVQDCFDIYDYDAFENAPGKVLTLIQKYLEKIDITNCFVLIVSSNPYISKEISVVNKTYSDTDDTMIEFSEVQGSYQKELSKQDTFCPLAWKSINLKADGQVTPCCSYDRPHNLGNLKNKNMFEILNGEDAKALRYNMLNDTKSRGCETCYHLEKHGKQSRRQFYIEKSSLTKNDAKKITTQSGKIDFNNILFDNLDLSLDSTCNLKCRCCSGDSSTLIALEEEKLFNLTRNKNKILNSQEKNIIVENIKPLLLNTKCVTFAGGEPTLLMGQYQVLDFLLDNNKTDVELRYAINGSNLTFKDKSIIDYWNKFKSVTVTVSIDGYKKQSEYLRHNSSWDTMLENVKRIKRECPHVELKVNSVISFLSLESTIHLQKNWHGEGIILGDWFNVSLITGHDGSYDIQALPNHHKQRLSEIITEHCKWLYSENQKILANKWYEIKNYMLSDDKQHKLSQAKRDIELIDSFRNENFYETFPELSNMFDDIKPTKH